MSREELLLLKHDADTKIKKLEGQCQELQSVIQQVSEDFQKVSHKSSIADRNRSYQQCSLMKESLCVFQSQGIVSTLEGSLHELQAEYDALKLQQQKVRMQFFWGFFITTCV